jgi:hypothetical protein
MKKIAVRIAFAVVVATGSAAGAPASWLQAPDNDPEVAALGSSALTCPWLQYGFAADCAPVKAWAAASAPFKDGRADATLVNML